MNTMLQDPFRSQGVCINFQVLGDQDMYMKGGYASASDGPCQHLIQDISLL